MPDTVKVGLIGLGRIGLKFSEETGRPRPASWIEALTRDSRFELVSAIDLDPEARVKAAVKYEVTTGDHVHLLPSHLDLAVVATPTKTHLEVVRELTNHCQVGVVVIEKPLAPTLTEAEYITERLTRGEIKSVVNFSRRFHPLWRLIWKKINEDGNLGGICGGVGIYQGDKLEVGIHMADLALWLAGKDAAKIHLNQIPHPSLHAFQLCIYGRNVTVCGSHEDTKATLYNHTPSETYQGYLKLDEHPQTFMFTPASAFPLMLNDIYTLVNGGEPRHIPSVEDGLKAQQLIMGVA